MSSEINVVERDGLICVRDINMGNSDKLTCLAHLSGVIDHGMLDMANTRQLGRPCPASLHREYVERPEEGRTANQVCSRESDRFVVPTMVSKLAGGKETTFGTAR